MYDPLSTPSPFASPADPSVGWPSVAHDPQSPFLRKPASPIPITSPEPQIYGTPAASLVPPHLPTGENGTRPERPPPYLRIRITALDRNRRDLLIRFDAQTNLPNFTGQTYRNVSRSYVELQRFYEQIVYSNPQTIIPALPLPQTSAPSDEEDDRLVKIMLQRWFSRICEDSILLNDEEVRSFIESDFGYQPTVRARRKTGSGFSLLGRRVPDEDEELLRARFELTRLEGQFFDAAKAIDRLSRARKAMCMAHVEMGNKLINVATTEVHPPLAVALRKFGRTWHSLGDLDQAKAISESVILGDSLGYQGMNARSAKETLLQRSQVLEEYQTAVKNTIAKRRQIERLKASTNIRPERVDDALEEMEEANKSEQILHRRVEGISQNLHKALQTHSRLAHDDITSAIIEQARSTIMYERQLLRELEGLRPDLSAAANRVPAVKPLAAAVTAPSTPKSAPALAHSVTTPSSPAVKTAVVQGASNFPGPSVPSSPKPSPSTAQENGVADPLASPTTGRFGSAVTSPSSTTGPSSPLAQSANIGPARIGTPPVGTKRIDGTWGGSRANTLARSVMEPPRTRLDAREAASKLANFL